MKSFDEYVATAEQQPHSFEFYRETESIAIADGTHAIPQLGRFDQLGKLHGGPS